jgi:hypothetical protein
MLNPHLYKRGPTKYQKPSADLGCNTKGHWTKEEDLMLADAVKKNGGKKLLKLYQDVLMYSAFIDGKRF